MLAAPGVLGGNLVAYPGYACATVTQQGAPFTAYAPGWVSGTGSAFFQLTEKWTGTSNLICS